jgi:hypothetical protein
VSKDASHLKIGRWLAVAMLVSGLGSAAATIFPTKFGDINWEFGTLGELAATSPLPVMGLTAVLVVSLYDRRRWAIGATGVLMLLVAILWLAAAALLVTDSPIILDAAKRAVASQSTSIKLVLVKSLALLGVFSLGLIGAGIGALRATGRGR